MNIGEPVRIWRSKPVTIPAPTEAPPIEKVPEKREQEKVGV